MLSLRILATGRTPQAEAVQSAAEMAHRETGETGLWRWGGLMPAEAAVGSEWGFCLGPMSDGAKGPTYVSNRRGGHTGYGCRIPERTSDQ